MKNNPGYFSPIFQQNVAIVDLLPRFWETIIAVRSMFFRLAWSNLTGETSPQVQKVCGKPFYVSEASESLLILEFLWKTARELFFSYFQAKCSYNRLPSFWGTIIAVRSMFSSTRPTWSNLTGKTSPRVQEVCGKPFYASQTPQKVYLEFPMKNSLSYFSILIQDGWNLTFF